MIGPLPCFLRRLPRRRPLTASKPSAAQSPRATAKPSSMAASLRGLALSPPPLVAPPTCAPSRRLVPSPRSRSGYGVRVAAAADGAPRPSDPVEVVGVGSRKDAVIDFCLGSRTLSSTPIRFWYGSHSHTPRVCELFWPSCAQCG